MRRALAILKYVPAVLCGLLVVAWVISLFVMIDVTFPLSVVGRNINGGMLMQDASAQVWYGERRIGENSANITLNKGQASFHNWFGRELIYDPRLHDLFTQLSIPFIPFLAILLPLAIGPFTRFRFPLWSYFAYTALMAALLAYYPWV
jgi:hypothetical protein